MRVLLVRAGALGDLLLLRRSIHALRRAGHRVALLAPGAPAAALHGSGEGEVDEILAFERPDVAALIGGGEAAPLREALGECQRIVAYTRSPDLLRALGGSGTPLVAQDPQPPAGRHAADWLKDAILDLVPFVPAQAPRLAPTADERAQAEPLLETLGGGFLALHPGSGSPAKNWPADRYRTLAERLTAGHRFLLVEGPADAAACDALRSLPGAVPARGLPLRVLGALLSRARLYVGNDSGVSHLAAAFGAPCLVLFGPTDATSWRPLGVSVHTLFAANGTIEALDVPTVVAAAEALAAALRAA